MGPALTSAFESAWVPAEEAGRREAQRQRAGAAADRDPLAVAEGVKTRFSSAASSAAVRWITAGLISGEGIIGTITSPWALKRGAIAIGLTLRTFCASPSSTMKAAGSAASAARSSPSTSARLCIVPPEIMSESLAPLVSVGRTASRSAVASSSLQRSRAVSVASRTRRSGGSASKPLVLTILTPAATARSWAPSIIRRTKGGSPVRSM